jgi:hypothetical protein
MEPDPEGLAAQCPPNRSNDLMIDRHQLTTALQAEVVTLIDDLRVRADTVEVVGELVQREWQAAFDAERTAHDADVWREGLLAQVAVSWVLGCVFIRFCEDNGLVTEPMISGRGEWRRWATDNQRQFFRDHTDAGERRYLTHVFEQAATVPGLDEVLGSHNPLWQFGPSDDACRELLAIWRATDVDSGELVWDFADPDWNTRFLGDLYQDLSDHAKKTYALLQTPDFVEAFILDRTLDPAIEEFGVNGLDGAGFRMIDPACGSGHFLLGAFDRLAHRWLAKEPASGRRAAAAKALDSVFGVDINPFAASIARFRLLVAALRFAEVTTLAEAPAWNVHVAVGDSLLHGPRPGQFTSLLDEIDSQSAASKHLYETEDPERIARYLGQNYHAVVANPPYIVPKDPAANTAYRDRYATCSGKYSLAVPFMERLFDLAERGAAGRPAGFVGQITADSFTKREFGKKLIETYLTTAVDLTHVVATSLAEIPGHNQTLIMLGRNRGPAGDHVRAVLGIRGEPNAPKVPADGLVWTSIERLVDQPGSENDYVSAVDLKRSILGTHPWSLQGGAAAPLKTRLEVDSVALQERSASIGITCFTLEDEFFLRPAHALTTREVPSQLRRWMGEGDRFRDWNHAELSAALFPYDQGTLEVLQDLPEKLDRLLWPGKTLLANNKMFGQKTKVESGLHWFEYGRFTASKLRTPLSIAFAEVATHNHFVLDRGGKVFKQTAPVIKLPADASEDDHLRLLGLLNSSVACFWLKQVCYCKTSAHGGGITSEPDTHMYAFDGSKLKQFPIADAAVLAWSAALDRTANELADALPASVAAAATPTAESFVASATQVAELRARMVWLQEELDWRCMHVYGVTDTDLSLPADQAFRLDKGERAFEIALARTMAAGEVTTTLFRRTGSTPITELPAHWPDWYRERVEQRLELIASDRFVNLLERPEYKRRWNWESWDTLANSALRDWLLTRLEDARYWAANVPQSIAQLADVARGDADFVQVAELYRHTTDVDLVPLIGELTTGDAVPYLAAWRYKDSGLRKRAVWERTWDLQRREDAGEAVGKIAVPPKYGSGDFRNATYWKLRGKLDVPKERFISYPGLERATDTTAVIGWAGWDHLRQAQALTTLYNARRNDEGWQAEQLTPILAGLDELVPWLRQWHNDIDPLRGEGLGDYFATYLAGEMQRNNVTPEQLGAWRPPATTRGRTKKATP